SINSGKSIERINRIKQEFVDELDFRSVRRGSAQYNAILCLLALNDAKDFRKERIVGTGDYSQENINDHHIFPKQVKGLEKEKSKAFRQVKDSILNRTLLLDATNNRIKNKRPSEYMRELIDIHGNEQKVQSIFQQHLINKRAFQCMKEDDFDGFIIEREKAIRQHL
ncbi:unnamed protein product, partial [marine sediment metagenome]